MSAPGIEQDIHRAFTSFLGPWITGLLSFCLLVFASWCVGEGAEILGKKYDASIIGGLLIASLNTAPETIFFVTALQSSNPRFAVGAVSGSTIVVSTVALGACYYFGTKARPTANFVLQPKVKQQCLLLGVSTLIPLMIAYFEFNAFLGFLGTLSYLAFVLWQLYASRQPVPEKSEDVEAGEASESDTEVSVAKGIGYLVVGGGLILVFSEPFITAVVDIATIAKVNSILLAFFLAPIASEMPEILESISLSRRGNLQNINIAVSNLMGGTITKTTLLCGIFCYFGVMKGFSWETPNYPTSLVLTAVCALVGASLGYLPRTQYMWHSFLLIGLFLVTCVLQYFFNSTFVEKAPQIPIKNIALA